MTQHIDLEDDFGFTLMDEASVKAGETEHVKLAADYATKLETVMAMVMPLLKNLAKDDGKEYIHWPDRVEKMKTFIKKLEAAAS